MERERNSGKKRGETGLQFPLVFFPLFRSFFACALFFARAPLSERLEQAMEREVRLQIVIKTDQNRKNKGHLSVICAKG